MIRSSIFITAAFALAACGEPAPENGPGNAAGSSASEGNAGVPTKPAAAPAKGGRTAALDVSDAYVKRVEAFENGAIIQCNYDVTNASVSFENDAAVVQSASFTLARKGQDSCDLESERGGRTAGMALDALVPAALSIATGAVNFRENNSDATQGEIIHQANIVADGTEGVDEIDCTSYTLKGELYLTCKVNSAPIDFYGLTATPESKNEKFDVTITGKVSF